MEQRIRIVWLDRDDAAEACLGLVELIGLVQNQAKVVERRQVIRLNLQRAAITFGRRFKVARRLLSVTDFF